MTRTVARRSGSAASGSRSTSAANPAAASATAANSTANAAADHLLAARRVEHRSARAPGRGRCRAGGRRDEPPGLRVVDRRRAGGRGHDLRPVLLVHASLRVTPGSSVAGTYLIRPTDPRPAWVDGRGGWGGGRGTGVTAAHRDGPASAGTRTGRRSRARRRDRPTPTDTSRRRRTRGPAAPRRAAASRARPRPAEPGRW